VSISSGFTLKTYPCVKDHINEAPAYGQVKYCSARVLNTPGTLSAFHLDLGTRAATKKDGELM
jgi:hypothetical protein